MVKSLPAVFYGFDPTLSNKHIKKEIEKLHNNGFTVMLKPHLWIGGIEFDPENWRNKIDYTNPGDLASWFYNYGNYIVKQAKLAENNSVEYFVIGTEFCPQSDLIQLLNIHIILCYRDIF